MNLLLRKDNHSTAVLLSLILGRYKKHDEEEFEGFSSSGQGFGNTESEKPETFEHSQVMGETEFVDKVILERHMLVKGDSSIPAKLPAMVMFVPVTSFKVM